MPQAQLRLYDSDERKEVCSIPLDRVPVIPRVGEIVILDEGSGDSEKSYEVKAVHHAYQRSPVVQVSVILVVKRRKPLEYGLIGAMEEMQAKGR
jgi:hypothetical protein